MEKSSSNKKSQIHYAIFFISLNGIVSLGLLKDENQKVTNNKEKHQVTIGWAK
jgi:hypothetical protein